MSKETWVIHWQNRWQSGLRAIIGNEAACVREILAGDEFMADEVMRVEHYDTDEGWSEVVDLYEIARAVASHAADNGGEISYAVQSFIHDHGNIAMAIGLTVIRSLPRAVL